MSLSVVVPTPGSAPCCWRLRYRHLSEISSLKGASDSYDAPVTHASTTTGEDLRPQAGSGFRFLGREAADPDLRHRRVLEAAADRAGVVMTRAHVAVAQVAVRIQSDLERLQRSGSDRAEQQRLQTDLERIARKL